MERRNGVLAMSLIFVAVALYEAAAS